MIRKLICRQSLGHQPAKTQSKLVISLKYMVHNFATTIWLILYDLKLWVILYDYWFSKVSFRFSSSRRSFDVSSSSFCFNLLLFLLVPYFETHLRSRAFQPFTFTTNKEIVEFLNLTVSLNIIFFIFKLPDFVGRNFWRLISPPFFWLLIHHLQ